MNLGLDEYTRNARLKPALLTALPGAIMVASWPSGLTLGWSALWALLVACGATAFLAQVARDWGKRLEQKLFDAQGGRPSERLLSDVHAPHRPLLAERHRKLRALLPHLRIPTGEEETNDPSGAREVYAACVAHMIAQTRDNPLLLKENINYGFRRNLLGLKPIGLTVAIVSTATTALQLLVLVQAHVIVPLALLVPAAVNVLILAAWLFVVRPDWLAIPSNAYGERLLEWVDKQASPPVAGDAGREVNLIIAGR